MTTDLSNKTIDELFMDNYSHEDWEVTANELALRLEEAQQKIAAYEKAACCPDEQACKYLDAQQRNAAHDAKIAAEAKAEALEEAIVIMVSLDQAEAGPKCWDDPVKYCTNLLRDKAAEYRAEAGRK